MSEEHMPSDDEIKKIREDAESFGINDIFEHTRRLEASQYKRDYSGISQTATLFNVYGHFDQAMIQGMIYMAVSRLLGPRVDINREQLSWLFGSNAKIAPNIYMLLVGPPGYFNRSTVVRNQNEWCDLVKKRYIEKFGEEIIPNDELKTTIIGSSLEGVTDDLAGMDIPNEYMQTTTDNDEFQLGDDDEEAEETKKGRKSQKKIPLHKYVYINAGECGNALKRLVNPNSYQFGVLDVLNDVFYGDEIHRTLRKSKVEIQPGQYVTFLGTIHLDELVSELLETGFLRRTVTIIRTEADYNFSAASLEEKKMWSTYYDTIKEEFINHMVDRASQIKNALVYIIPAAEEYLNTLDNKIKTGRVETKDSNEYPSRNLELIVRLAILHAIYEGVVVENTIYITTNEIYEAEDFLRSVDKRYRSYTSKLISSDILRRIDLIVSVIENHYKVAKEKGIVGLNMFATRSTLYHHLPYLDSVKIKDLENRAIEMGRIKGAELYRLGRKPKNILFPRSVPEREIEAMIKDGDRIIFR